MLSCVFMHISVPVQRAEINMRALPKLLFPFLFLHLFIVCMCHARWGKGMHMPGHTCEGQRTACGSQSSLSTAWVPGIQLRSSHYAVGAFGH